MKLMSVKEYARAHKTSIFMVVKKITSGELESVTMEEDGKKVNYVVVREDPAAESSADGEGAKLGAEIPDVASLAAEMARLREEVKRLEAKLRECCEKER